MTASTTENVSNKDLVHLLNSVAAAYILTDVSPFRIRAYQKAVDSIEGMTQELYDVWQDDDLESFGGVGSTLKQHLREYFKNPKDNYLIKQTERIPATVYELMKAPGIGPKKAYKIVQEFDLNDTETIFEDVVALAEKNKISKLEGFGEKSEKDIVKAIGIYEERGKKEERMLLPVAFQLAEDLIAYLKKSKYVKRVDTLGSLRRMAPTIGDVDLAVLVDDGHGDEVVEHFVKYSGKQTIEGKGASKASITVTGGKWVDLRIVSKQTYGPMLQHNTGSKHHNIKLREYALKKGYSLNEFAITEKQTGKKHEFESEEDFYSFLGLQYVPPELREGTDEVQLAQKKKLPKLVQEQDIQGEFHIHSNFDIVPSHDLGKDSFQDMVKKALERNYSYLAFSEHNPAQSKLSDEEIIELVLKKKKAIEKVQEKNKDITLYNALEIDILPDGELALPEKAFEHLDLAVASVHSSFRMKREEMTKRILKAIKHPKVKILGHPTGRLLQSREEIDVDWDEVLSVIKKKDMAIEINSSPKRLDLPDRLVKKAVEMNVKLVIDTDAHATKSMDLMFYGVSVARRGWAEKSDIINTQSVKQINDWLRT